MDARLFFAMLQKGRLTEFRRNSRMYYELCRVAQYPVITQEGRKEVLQYHWDNSLTEMELAAREARIAKIKGDAKAKRISHADVRAFVANVRGGR